MCYSRLRAGARVRVQILLSLISSRVPLRGFQKLTCMFKFVKATVEMPVMPESMIAL